MANLISEYWNNIGGVDSTVFGIGSFGNGGANETEFRHFMEVKHLKKIIKFSKEMKVLELGCGAGRFAVSVAPFVKKYVGVDLSEKGLNIARKVCKNKKIYNVEFIKKPIEEFETDEKFDVIYFGSVLQYLKDEEIVTVLKNIQNLIKEDTIIIDRSSIFSKVRRVSDTILYYCIYRTPNELEKLFSQINYELVYHKRSYRFLKSIVLVNKCNMLKFISFYVMLLITFILDKCVFNRLRENYFSHDFFVYKRRGV